MIRQTYLSCPQIPHIITRRKHPISEDSTLWSTCRNDPNSLNSHSSVELKAVIGSKAFQNHCWTENDGASLEDFVASPSSLIPNRLFAELRAMKTDTWIMNLLSLKDSVTLPFSLGTSKASWTKAEIELDKRELKALPCLLISFVQREVWSTYLRWPCAHHLKIGKIMLDVETGRMCWPMTPVTNIILKLGTDGSVIWPTHAPACSWEARSLTG